MLLFGCLLAFGIAFAPRLMLILAWIFSDRWQFVWGDQWIAPLLGIIFLPFTTVMYMVVWTPNGIEGWDWLWIALGLFVDLTHYAQGFVHRRQVPGYATATTTLSGGGAVTPPPAAPAQTPAPAPVATPVAPPVAPPVATPVATPVAPPVAPAPPIESPPAVAPPEEPPSAT